MKTLRVLALAALLTLASGGLAMAQQAGVCGFNGTATFTNPIGVVPQTTTDGLSFKGKLGEAGVVAPAIQCEGTGAALPLFQGATIAASGTLEVGANCAASAFVVSNFTVTLSNGQVCNGSPITGAAAGGVVSGTPATFTCNGGAANGTWETTFVLEFPTENGSGPATECAANALVSLNFSGAAVSALP